MESSLIIAALPVLPSTCFLIVTSPQQQNQGNTCLSAMLKNSDSE